MLFKLINQFLSLKIKPPKNYDLPLPLHGIIIRPANSQGFTVSLTDFTHFSRSHSQILHSQDFLMDLLTTALVHSLVQ